MSLNWRSVVAASIRCAYDFPFDDGSASAASTTSFGMPSFSRRRSISFHAIRERPGTRGSVSKLDSWPVTATAAQTFS